MAQTPTGSESSHGPVTPPAQPARKSVRPRAAKSLAMAFPNAVSPAVGLAVRGGARADRIGIGVGARPANAGAAATGENDDQADEG